MRDRCVCSSFESLDTSFQSPGGRQLDSSYVVSQPTDGKASGGPSCDTYMLHSARHGLRWASSPDQLSGVVHAVCGDDRYHPGGFIGFQEPNDICNGEGSLAWALPFL